MDYDTMMLFAERVNIAAERVSIALVVAAKLQAAATLRLSLPSPLAVKAAEELYREVLSSTKAEVARADAAPSVD